jgi:hypothetical protein
LEGKKHRAQAADFPRDMKQTETCQVGQKKEFDRSGKTVAKARTLEPIGSLFDRSENLDFLTRTKCYPCHTVWLSIRTYRRGRENHRFDRLSSVAFRSASTAPGLKTEVIENIEAMSQCIENIG